MKDRDHPALESFEHPLQDTENDLEKGVESLRNFGCFMFFVIVCAPCATQYWAQGLADSIKEGGAALSFFCGINVVVFLISGHLAIKYIKDHEFDSLPR